LPLVKLVDFGIACPDGTTFETTIVGTKSYMAPELMNKPKVTCTKQTDAFSFGVFLWEIISGKYPFNDDPAAQEEAYHKSAKSSLKGKSTSPLQLNDNYPADERMLVEDCLQFSPMSRPDFKKIVETLETINNRYNRREISFYVE